MPQEEKKICQEEYKAVLIQEHLKQFLSDKIKST